MNKSDAELAPVRLPARDIPPPSTISPQARAALSAGALAPAMNWPAADDLEGWRLAARGSEATFNPVAEQLLAACRASVTTEQIGGVTCYVSTPPEPDASGRVYLYLHGGALLFGDGVYAKAHGAVNAERLGITTVSVDYRMPPAHPYPAAPQDCVAVYRELLKTYGAARILIGGSSAGGNLAAAATLMIRDGGLPLPAAVILLTPEIDLTEAGDTFRTNALLDVVLKGGLPTCNAAYAAGHDLTDPYVSPLFGDFTKGFPPTFIQSGTRDLFLSNSVLMHRKLRKAGVEAELHVWEAMPHAGFGNPDAPENREIDEELRQFIARHA
jgi:monoterpene epsilon-lactone hydrolase